MDCAVFCLSFNGRLGPLARQQTKKSLLKLLPDLVPCPLRPPVVCVYRKNPIQRRRLMALSLHAYRSASASAARPFDERRAGRRISSSVRPSVPHQMTPPPNRPTSLWDFTRRPKVSRSFGPDSGAVKLLQFLRCSGFARKIQCPNVPLRNDRKSSRSDGGK